MFYRPGSIVVRFDVIVINVEYDASTMKAKLNQGYHAVSNPGYVIKDQETSFIGKVAILQSIK